MGHLPRGRQEHLGQALGLLHGRLDAVEAERVGRLLGVVDDVVDRRGERVAVAQVHGPAAAAAAVEAVDDVVGDAVSLLLAEQDLPGEAGPLRVVRDQLAQQPGGAGGVSTRLLVEREQLVVHPSAKEAHSTQGTSAFPLHLSRSRVFHTRFTAR